MTSSDILRSWDILGKCPSDHPLLTLHNERCRSTGCQGGQSRSVLKPQANRKKVHIFQGIPKRSFWFLMNTSDAGQLQNSCHSATFESTFSLREMDAHPARTGSRVTVDPDLQVGGFNGGFRAWITTGWWLTYPSEKYESQLGRLFPTEWTNKIHVPKQPEFVICFGPNGWLW